MQIQAGAPLITPPGTDDLTPAHSRPRRLLYLALLLVAVPIYVADQLTKVWAVAHLQPGHPQDLIGSVLRLNLTRNPGAAFSIATGATWILTAIACSVVIFIVVIARRLGSRGWALALGLLLGGSLGNLTDRMLRAPGPGRGHVVDFLELPHYPIFNIADSAIVIAAVLIAVLAFRGISVDGTRVASSAKHHDDAPEGTEPEDTRPESTRPENTRPESSRQESSRQEPPQQPAGTDHDA